MKKTCSCCDEEKPIKNFYKRKTGKRAGELYEKCKECMKARGRAYYHKNKNRQLNLARNRTNKARALKRKYLVNAKDKPCSDCGVKYPHYVLDFDHKNKNDKIDNIAHLVNRNWSLKKIKEEISKCDIVCANCHRERTWGSKHK